MHHALILTSRIVAGVVAAVAFYFAFFLYEEEEGQWQSRIELLWFSIDDRAKQINSTSTALLNTIGQLLINALTRIFGSKVFSVRAFAMSTWLSILGGTLRHHQAQALLSSQEYCLLL
jgi:hypothetical protein